MASNGGGHVITTLAQLEALYPEPVYPPAKVKETDRITNAYRALIEASPFFALATCGPDGLDCSPRGDPKGFVRVVDDRTIVVPDRRGNNRIDSLRNLLHDPRVALLFLIPGVSETLRIMGRATIQADPDLCASFTMQGKAPRSVLVIASSGCSSSAPRRSCAPNCGTPRSRSSGRACRRRGKSSPRSAAERSAARNMIGWRPSASRRRSISARADAAGDAVTSCAAHRNCRHAIAAEPLQRCVASAASTPRSVSPRQPQALSRSCMCSGTGAATRIGGRFL